MGRQDRWWWLYFANSPTVVFLYNPIDDETFPLLNSIVMSSCFHLAVKARRFVPSQRKLFSSLFQTMLMLLGNPILSNGSLFRNLCCWYYWLARECCTFETQFEKVLPVNCGELDHHYPRRFLNDLNVYNPRILKAFLNFYCMTFNRDNSLSYSLISLLSIRL